jgi:hypothetical protein
MNQLFSTIEPSQTLKCSIINKIKIEESKRTIYKMVFSSVVSLASVSTAVIFVINIIKDASQSGLSEYLSLMFSDGASIISFWQTYVMSIMESLPIIPITIVVASIWIFVWSLNSVLQLFKETELVKKLKV